MTYHNYVAVIGRIPYDDEDSILFFEQCTLEEAYQRFSDEMYEGDSKAREDNIRAHGCDGGVYVNAVLASDSPIKVVC